MSISPYHSAACPQCGRTDCLIAPFSDQPQQAYTQQEYMVLLERQANLFKAKVLRAAESNKWPSDSLPILQRVLESAVLFVVEHEKRYLSGRETSSLAVGYQDHMKRVVLYNSSYSLSQQRELICGKDYGSSLFDRVFEQASQDSS